jgi:hypothetical protein
VIKVTNVRIFVVSLVLYFFSVFGILHQQHGRRISVGHQQAKESPDNQTNGYQGFARYWYALRLHFGQYHGVEYVNHAIGLIHVIRADVGYAAVFVLKGDVVAAVHHGRERTTTHRFEFGFAFARFD